MAEASAGVAVRPVPIAHTGSYASTTCPTSASVSSASPASSCRSTTASVIAGLALRQRLAHAQHRDQVRVEARRTLRPVASSVSPKTCRRSECPISTARAPASRAIAPSSRR
jgi:hypothetical protein